MKAQKYKKGDVVEVWSNSKGAWLPDATILEAYEVDVMMDTYSVPAGALKVQSSAGTKYIMPDDVPKHVRLPPKVGDVGGGGLMSAFFDGIAGAIGASGFAHGGSASSPASASLRPMCKFNCGRRVQPGLTRGLKSFDTCCKKCATSGGGGSHDPNCEGQDGDSRPTSPMGASLGGQRAKEWLEKTMSEDAFLKTFATQIFAECAGGEGGRLTWEQAWAAIEERLLEPLGTKLSVTEPERQEILTQIAHARKRFSFARASAESSTLDADVFREVCRLLLSKKYAKWFPPKLPTKSRYFVRRNPLRIEDVYEFGKQLGEGSFGVVHSVTHKVSGQERVCKRIPKLKGKTGMKVEEIMQEIESMAMLDHPNVIKVYEYFEDKVSICQIMEPCRGGELQDKIDAVFRKKKETMYSEAFMRDVIKQTLRALAFIHGERFMHKDLKPQNIMLKEQPEAGANNATIKIIDFGLAELFSKDQRVSEQFGGTLLYMAPEVLHVELTMKSDIWSVGVILYNLITGDYPFMATWPLPEGKTMEWWQSEVSRLIQDKKVKMKDNKKFKDGSVSNECVMFLRRLLDKNAKERPSAEECLEDPWFTKFETRLVPLSVGVTQCLEAYSNMPELKKALFLLIAHQSSLPALHELRAVFTHFDVKNRGALSEENLLEVLNKSGISPMKAEQIVYALDRDGSGLISWTEFIAAALCISVCHSKPLISAAFHVFDTDQDEKVDEKDLLAVFGQGDGHTAWKIALPAECLLLSDRSSGGFTKAKFTKDNFMKYMGAFVATSAGDQLRAVT